MAHRVTLIHEPSGIAKSGYYEFSWTTLFFGFLPALFRADWLTFLGGIIIWSILATLTFGIGGFVAYLAWAFMYNRYYTRSLIERGYRLADTDSVNEEAKRRLGTATLPRAP